MPRKAERIIIGETSITYLIDGVGLFNPEATMPAVDWAANHDCLEESQLVLPFGSFLVRAGDQKILVDLALGGMDMKVPGVAHMKGGELLQSLAAEGLSPDDIDTVVYTHLHVDHIGWTTDVAPVPNAPEPKAPSGLTFARARHVMTEAEWRYWTGEAAGELGGPDTEATIKPLQDVIEFVQDGDTLAPGVTIEVTAGHTPGHLAVVVHDPSGDHSESVFIAGDLFHSPVEIADTVCTFASDVDPERVRAVRDGVLQRPDTVIAAGHFTHGAFGRATPVGDTYTWTPIGHAPTAG
ncbi:MBL fold metallo-hydrolase [Streptomyces sp. NPDC046805]|uniref:MBL fold metallo-hydrolase n=1 Tax=Streptomyces sp. NPDC046805 TaxID=3155134 RepID=UPI0033F1C9C7